jgi:cellulose synthase/poly-beta-1,6-N-acetylglucosamine synthase-like glycosyltransferase
LAQRWNGVSIITCTNRQNFANNIFKNYNRQIYPKKELVIILNDDKMNIDDYKKMAEKYEHVQVFQLPEKLSLGDCLNFAVEKTNYPYIAKFDDDNYYAPYYLADNMLTLIRTNADVVGKRAHYMYLKGSKMLILRSYKAANRYVSTLPGATLVFKRAVFRNVRFPNQTVGEDTKFCLNCKAKGYKIYSGGKYNFLSIRRKNSKDHTWIISDQKLLESSIKYPRVRKYSKFINKRPGNVDGLV